MTTLAHFGPLRAVLLARLTYSTILKASDCHALRWPTKQVTVELTVVGRVRLHKSIPPPGLWVVYHRSLEVGGPCRRVGGGGI